MFVARFKSPTPGRKYFKVIESFREGGIVKKRHINGLAFHRTVQDAYQAALKDYLKALDKLERLEHVLCLCKVRGLKVAIYGSQGIFKTDTMELLKRAALVSFGIELPDLYCELVLTGRLRFKQAVRLYQQRLSDYKLIDREVH